MFTPATRSLGFSTFFCPWFARGLKSNGKHLSPCRSWCIFSLAAECAVISVRFGGLFKLLSRQKSGSALLIVFLPFTGFVKPLSCPASSCITWQNEKGMRCRGYIMCCVERRYNHLRGHWGQVGSRPKCLRNVPTLGLNVERAINQSQVMFFR